MLKKVLVGVVASAAVGSLVFGWDTWSYVKTSVTSVRKAVKSEVPLAFELERARTMVAQLDGEVRKCLHVIAEEEVNVEELRKDLDSQLAIHDQQKNQIMVQRKDLELKKASYTYGGRIYTVSEVQTDLADRFSRYKTVEETLTSKRQVLSAREKALAAARKKLDSMLDAKERLIVDIENLEAKVKTLDAAQVASAIELNDSQVSQARKLVSDLNKRVDVEQKLLDGAGNTTGLIPIEVAGETQPDVTAQIDQYFSGKVENLAATNPETKIDVQPVSAVTEPAK